MGVPWRASNALLGSPEDCVLAASPGQLEGLEEEAWAGVGTPEQSLGRGSRERPGGLS